MNKPIAVLDPQWRKLDELFSAADLSRLGELCDLVWAKNEPMPKEVLDENLARMTFYLSALPVLDAGQIVNDHGMGPPYFRPTG